MQRFGMTYAETGALTVWQLNELVQIMQQEEKERERSERSSSRSAGQPGLRRTPVMT
jgi:hypothetical protein